jgi:LemA protein
MIISVIIVIAIIALIALWAMQSYNSLVRLKNIVQEAWSGIDVQLKRRYDLVPNLVKVVKQYSVHEKEVLENVTKMRNMSANTQGVEKKAAAEAGLTGALKSLFAVAENYPNLKANENFLKLQDELSRLEEEIQLARRYYNGAARNYNITVESFPSRIIAGAFGFSEQPYFELDTEEARKNPDITF